MCAEGGGETGKTAAMIFEGLKALPLRLAVSHHCQDLNPGWVM